MPVRSHQCGCCPEPAAPCNQCGDGATQLVIEVEYPSGSGVMIKAAEEEDGYTYGEIKTTCTPISESKCVSLISITDAGEGYTSLPSVVLSCGTVPLGSVVESPIVSIAVTAGGSGYTSAPAVALTGAKFSGGKLKSQIEAASLYCDLSAKVSSIQRTAGGSGYTTAPTVHLHGGGGSGATAEATISGGSVSAVSLTAAGSGYRYPPTVAFTGGGGTGAAATAAIVGSVDAVRIVSPGVYKISSDPESTTTFPTVSFSGGAGAGAVASIEWSGVLTGILVPNEFTQGCTGKDCELPTVAISGGGGTGAAAVAFSSVDEAIVIDIDDGCGASLGHVVAFDSTSSNGIFPLDVEDPEPAYLQEGGGWSVSADLSLGFGLLGGSSDPEVFFSREAYRVAIEDTWTGITFNQSGTVVADTTSRLRHFVRPNAARISPQVDFTIPSQPSQASLPTIASAWAQDLDDLGRPYWKLSGATLTSPGRNLLIADTSAGQLYTNLTPHNSNLFGGSVFNALFPVAYSWASPVVAFTTVAGFATQPVFAVTFRSVAGVNGRYEINTVSIVSGGVAEEFFFASSRAVTISLDLGYQQIATTITATVSGGTVTAVNVTNRGRFSGPATITSLGAIASPQGLAAGSSTQTLVTTYSEPEVAARGPRSTRTVRQGSGAVLSVALQEQTDSNGRQYWEVESVAVVHGGGYYLQGERVVFVLGVDAYEQSPALATVNLPARREPTIHSVILPRGGGAEVRVVIESAGAGLWTVGEIEIISGGSGYTDGEYIRIVFDQYVVEIESPDAYTVTDPETGEITGITFGEYGTGSFYGQDRYIESVSVVRGGRYYKKVATTTEIPIASGECLGGPGDWEELEYEEPDPPVDETEIGDEYTRQFPIPGSPSAYLQLTRRCPSPNISFSIQ